MKIDTFTKLDTQKYLDSYKIYYEKHLPLNNKSFVRKQAQDNLIVALFSLRLQSATVRRMQMQNPSEEGIVRKFVQWKNSSDVRLSLSQIVTIHTITKEIQSVSSIADSLLISRSSATQNLEEGTEIGFFIKSKVNHISVYRLEQSCMHHFRTHLPYHCLTKRTKTYRKAVKEMNAILSLEKDVIKRTCAKKP